MTRADILISKEDIAGKVIKIKISEDSNSFDLQQRVAVVSLGSSGG